MGETIENYTSLRLLIYAKPFRLAPSVVNTRHATNTIPLPPSTAYKLTNLGK